MKSKLKELFGNRFVMAWLLVLILIAGVLVTRWWFVSQQAPTLSEVLNRSTVKQSPDFSILIASLLALSLATMSAAKGYEVYKRNSVLTCAVIPEEPVSVASEKTAALQGLQEDVTELSKVKTWLQQENIELKERLANIAAETEEIAQAEKMLRKSNISLSKECERLKVENEMLLLKVSSMALRPKQAKGKIRTRSLKRRKKKTTK
ncbi:MAG: hypothetical protein KJ732_05245 [Candidatus Margulisbacteria bacterium]|nr:hypothetical protein [Candidatus Margulisiibacteriota bacterium]